jgi:type I restriction enzyme R subunit
VHVKDHSTEADARIIIDDLLRQAGWDPADKSQVLTEFPLYHTEQFKPGDVGEGPKVADTYILTSDGDQVPTGKADYVLQDRRGRPLAIIEAKRSAIEPYTAKQQALPYAKRIGSPFIFLTNGELIYFWDYGNDDARIVNSFFSRRDLERLIEMRDTRKPLATIEIPEYYLRQGETTKVRPYQQEAIQAPALVKIREAYPVPRSKDPKFYKYWTQVDAPIIPVEEVCAQWEGKKAPD